MSFDLGNALKTLAPTLATMLGGPLAGTAVTALEGAFGLSAGAGTDGITAALQAGQMTPEIAAAVRAADQKHAETLAQQQIDLAKLNADSAAAMATTDAADRDSARKREESVKDNVPALLATLVTVGFFGILLGLMGGFLKVAGSNELMILLGALSTAWTGIVAYYFGSSSGSKGKDDTIKAMAGK